MNPYQRHIEGKDPLAVLGATPQKLRDLAEPLTDLQLQAQPIAGKWSMHEIVAHLADCELVFSARCRWILYEQNKTLAGFDQDKWVSGWRREKEPFAETLDRFRVLRVAQIRLFRSASPGDLARTALHEEYGPESAGEYMNKSAGHDLHHLEQLAHLQGKLL